MQIGHLVYTHCDTANWHGAPCLELVLQGQLQASLMDLVEAIDQAVGEMDMKSGIVVVDGSAMHDNDPKEVHELVKVLKQRQMLVMGKSDGTVYPLWFDDCACKVVHVRGKWLNYVVNEVQYRPSDEDALEEPLVFEGNRQAVKLLVLDKKRSIKELAKFNEKAVWPWSVLVPRMWEYMVKLI